MVKIETLGMLDVAKINPILKVNAEVKNYQFVTVDGIVYLVCNTVTGDKAYEDNAKFAANEYLNGYQLDAWVGQKLVADEKHIAYGDNVDFDDITAGTTLMGIKAATGELEILQAAPDSGLYFKVVEKTHLTGNAVKLLVIYKAPVAAQQQSPGAV